MAGTSLDSGPLGEGNGELLLSNDTNSSSCLMLSTKNNCNKNFHNLHVITKILYYENLELYGNLMIITTVIAPITMLLELSNNHQVHNWYQPIPNIYSNLLAI